MVLTNEEAESIREQLLEQVQNFPEDKRETIKEKILSLSNDELEDFIEQNQIKPRGKCIFCEIVGGGIPSYKILEDSENQAILEINPMSKGHTIVLSKSHDKIPSEEFAQKTENLLKERLKPKEVRSKVNNIMGHPLVELMPIFGGEKEKKKATDTELSDLKELLTKEEPKKVEIEIKEEKKEPAVLPRLKARIP